MLQNLKDFNSMSMTSKIEYLRTAAKFFHPVEKGNHILRLLLKMTDWRKHTSSMCKENTAPTNPEVSRPYASIDAEQEIGSVLNIGLATVIDVPVLKCKYHH